jgi:hypothetical protein
MRTGYLMGMTTTLVLLLLAGCDPGQVVEEEPENIEVLDCDACGGDCLYEKVTLGESSHVEGGVDYEDTPPTGGNHDPCWAAWGEHAEELADEQWVHNMEHGGVVLLYNCPGGCETERASLAGFVEDHPGNSLLAPYADMDGSFAIVAWRHRLETDCLDMDAFTTFYDTHVDQAPESTQSMPPAACMDTGGGG